MSAYGVGWLMLRVEVTCKRDGAPAADLSNTWGFLPNTRRQVDAPTGGRPKTESAQHRPDTTKMSRR